MRLSKRVARLNDGAAGEGVQAWDLHTRALAAQARGEDVIVLSVGDPDLITPEPIRAAAKAALDAGDTRYTPIPGRPRLRTLIAERFSAASGLSVGPERVMVTGGAQNALFYAMLTLIDPGDVVVAPEPTYVLYGAPIAAAGGRMVRTPSPAAGGFRPDLDALEAAAAGARLLILANPNNPTGVVLTEAELDRIAAIACAHDLWVVVDEVYESLAFDRPHLSLAAWPGMAERTLTVSAVSKTFAMTGWRVGWTIAPEAVVAAFADYASIALYGLPGFAQAGAIAALEQPDLAAPVQAAFRRRRDELCSALDAIPRVRAHRPEAGLFALLDVSATGRSAEAFSEQLFASQGVSVLNGAAFGPSATGHVRVSTAVETVHLLDGCARIRHFIESI